MQDAITELDFMDPTAGGDQGDVAHLVMEVVQNFLRQTGGFGKVASRGAVFNRDGLFVVSHASSSWILSTCALAMFRYLIVLLEIRQTVKTPTFTRVLSDNILCVI